MRVTSGARDRAEVRTRRVRFVVGKPLDFDAESETISAVEYLLGALGADLVNGFLAVARRRRVDVLRVEATVEGRLDNPLTHLAVVGETGHPGLARAIVKMYVSSLDSEDAVQRIWDETLERSPLVCTLRRCVLLDLHLQRVA